MSISKKVVVAEKAPKAIGPYSVGMTLGNVVYTAGQIPVDAATGKIVEGGIEAETRQSLANLKYVLEAAGSDLDHVVKTTCFLADMGEFAAFNAIYAEFFTDNPPARSTIAAKTLPLNVRVEVEAIAYIPEK
ncbi:MAG: RidA family protein [Anaerolineae bacterium]|jgi:2-iminobutanoate/2-iminopropanoate deaminase|nr:RidA family protein [Anaerolineae bacterium]MBT7072435.1 RidA family protein [Anaerolineae bacterium]MBT7326568.1 RidA family protein [Anaerolineae bacterium]